MDYINNATKQEILIKLDTIAINLQEAAAMLKDRDDDSLLPDILENTALITIDRIKEISKSKTKM